MSILAPIADAIVVQITGVILPALLTVIGAFTLFIVAVYGALHLYVMFRSGPPPHGRSVALYGEESKSGVKPGFVGYAMGRIFGSLIYENEYQKYKSKRDGQSFRRDREASFRDRYDKF